MRLTQRFNFLRGRDECGVISAVCSNSGEKLVIDVQGYESFVIQVVSVLAATVSDYGTTGIISGGELKSLTLSGKDDRATEAEFAKGPARAAYPMADIRNDGREKKMFDEGESGKGRRRRNTHAP